MIRVRVICRPGVLPLVLGDGALAFSSRHLNSSCRSCLLVRSLSCVWADVFCPSLEGLRICLTSAGHEAFHHCEDDVVPLRVIVMPGVMMGQTFLRVVYSLVVMAEVRKLLDLSSFYHYRPACCQELDYSVM